MAYAGPPFFISFTSVFFLSVLKKNKHTAYMCGGIKTCEEHVATRLLWLLKSNTHEQNTSSKTYPKGCNIQVHDPRVCYFFRLLRIERNEDKRRKTALKAQLQL